MARTAKKKTAKKKTAKKSTAKKKTAKKKTAKKKTAKKKTAKKKTAKKKTAKKKTAKKETAKKKAASAAASTKYTGLPRDFFQFLGELGLNNERPWFEENKPRYEASVREPALAFVRAMGQRLPKFSKQFVASDKKVGGSMMRIYRDVRFSKDKTPYKTNVGIHFRHVAGKDVHAPGIYVHFDTRECFVGVGLWRPESDALRALREHLVNDPKGWKTATRSKSFTKVMSLGGEAVTRGPRGFDTDHPLIDDIRRKDFIAVADLKAGDMTKPGFPDALMTKIMAAKPLTQWLCKALGLAF